MPFVNKSTHLNIPSEPVYHYLSDPTHLLEYCQSIVDISEVQRHPPNNAHFEWIYKIFGVRFEGEAELKEVQRNQQLNIHFRGGIQGEATWHLNPSDEGTLLKAELDYIIPPPLLKKHGADMITQHLEHNVECMLANLKMLLEAQYARTFHRM